MDESSASAPAVHTCRQSIATSGMGFVAWPKLGRFWIGPIVNAANHRFSPRLSLLGPTKRTEGFATRGKVSPPQTGSQGDDPPTRPSLSTSQTTGNLPCLSIY